MFWHIWAQKGTKRHKKAQKGRFGHERERMGTIGHEWAHLGMVWATIYGGTTKGIRGDWGGALKGVGSQKA